MKTSFVLKPLALMALVWLGGCAGPTAQPPSGADMERLFRDQYVAPFMHGDAVAWARVFAPNAVGLHDRRPADVGREAIAKFGAMVAEHIKIDRFDIQVDEVRVHGNWVLMRGRYDTRLLARSDGKDTGLGGEGKFLIVWERQPEGDWKIIMDMGNRRS